MTTLTLIRHGQTDWNLQRLIQGATDIALNDTGRAQARETAAALRIDAPTVLVSSDLVRASETAEIIAEALGLPAPLLHPGLRERNYGEAEGTSSLDFLDRYGPWDEATVPGAETGEQLRDRAMIAIQEIVKVATRLTAPEEPNIIAVAHGALIGAVLRHVTDGELPRPGVRLENGAAFTFVIDDDVLAYVDRAAV